MLNVDQSRAWAALGIGPQWLLRESEDPLCPSVSALAPEPPAIEKRAETKKPEPFPESLRRTVPIRDRRETPRPMSAAAEVPARADKPQSVTLALDAKTAEAIPSADWETLHRLADACRCCSMASTRHHVVFAEGRPGVRLATRRRSPGKRGRPAGRALCR